jgi:hypothetical protein
MQRIARVAWACFILGAAASSACAESADAPTRLDQLVIEDPNFTFATARSVTLSLEAEGTAPKAVEVADAEGRRLMNGAFRGSAQVQLKVPVGADGKLIVRVGQGADVVTQDVTPDAAGRAAARF